MGIEPTSEAWELCLFYFTPDSLLLRSADEMAIPTTNSNSVCREHARVIACALLFRQKRIATIA